jgi:NAD kinase
MLTDNFLSILRKQGNFNIELKNEADIEEKDMKNIDLCISIGGDNTFLKAASVIRDPS